MPYCAVTVGSCYCIRARSRFCVNDPPSRWSYRQDPGVLPVSLVHLAMTPLDNQEKD